MKQEIEKIRSIVQSNDFTNARFDLSSMELNILFKIIEKIRKEPHRENMFNENLVVEFFPKDFSEVADQDHTNQAKEALRSLRRKEMDITDKDGNWINMGFINYAEYKAKFKTFEVEVSKKILPHFLQLTEKFTTINILVLLSFKSKYTKRLYEIACQYRNKAGKSFFLEIDDLRQKLRLGKGYKLKSDIKKRVIDVALEELKEAFEKKQSDIWLQPWEKGIGNKTVFWFKIHERNEDNNIPDINTLEEQLRSINQTNKAIFKKDSKFCKRIEAYLREHTDLIPQVLGKQIKVMKTYAGKGNNDVPRVMRCVYLEDFGIQ